MNLRSLSVIVSDIMEGLSLAFFAPIAFPVCPPYRIFINPVGNP